MTDTLEHAGRVALNTGLLAWQRDITDPTRKAFGDPAFAEDRAFIDSCIRSDDGLGWSRCSAFVMARSKTTCTPGGASFATSILHGLQ